MSTTELQYTPLEEINAIHAAVREGHKSGKLRSIEYRKYQLLQLGYLVKDNAKRFEEALKADLGRPALESYFLEINLTINDIKHAYNNVEKWSRPEKAPFSLNFAAMRPVVYKEAKGVVLIISPFNYPLWLSLQIMAGAIAAGNSVVLKPSESAKANSVLFAELIPKYMDPDLFRVVNGAVAETTRLLELPWDHILYTGSGRVGKIVASAAAKFLTPVTLELGGKSPVIVDPNCDIEMTARRVLWGKVINAGQTCIAPDYILVPKSFQDKLIDALVAQYKQFYPDNEIEEDQYSKLISPQAFKRVKGLLDASKGTIVIGGEIDENRKFIAPTIVKDCTGEDSLLSEEIFGPLLPIVPVDDIDEAIAFVNARDHPLVLYVFSRDQELKQKIYSSTKSGAVVANETMIHPGADGLPFGGVGASGYGCHTGKFTFDTFTHLRSSLDSPNWLDKILGFRFPPYTTKKIKNIDLLMPANLPPRPTGPPAIIKATTKWSGKWLLLALAVAVAGALTKWAKTASKFKRS
ncbi:NAD-aldehyde dehydrogenase [Amanita rubescens]|nr:NAD-aldehyde dehydrogenase [Amanita rubescens]